MMVAAEVLSDCRNVWRQGPMPMPLDDYSFGCGSASQTTNLTASGMIGTLTATLRVTDHRRALFCLSGLFSSFRASLSGSATNQEVAGSSPAGRAKSTTYGDAFSCQNRL
jgi:hypothetical protein